jgi:hypothetical protein
MVPVSEKNKINSSAEGREIVLPSLTFILGFYVN